MEQLRIALVSMHTSPVSVPGAGDAGGMNVVVLEQAKRLATAGHLVDLITRRSDSAATSRAEVAPNLTLRFLDAGPAQSIDKGEHEGHIEEFATRLRELGPYDVMHSHHWFSGMAALPIACERRIPHLQSFHSIAAEGDAPLAEGERAESPGRLAGETWLAQQSDAVVTVSEYEARVAVARLGAQTGRVIVVPPGVSTELFHPAEAPREQLPYVVVAGRIHPLKGMELAIDAVALVPAGQRSRLVVAGHSSHDLTEYAASLRSRAEYQDVAVEFVGAQGRAHLAALFRGAAAVLVPSHSETFGLVALEAAATAVPVLASAAGGLPEAVVDGVTGLVLDTREPSVWADALTRLLSDEEFAHRLGQAARERAVTFTWERSAQRLLDVYATTAENRRQHQNQRQTPKRKTPS